MIDVGLWSRDGEQTRPNLLWRPSPASVRGPDPRRHVSLALARPRHPQALCAASSVMTRMPLPTPLLSVLLLCLLPLATAHIIHVAAAQKECFFEDLNVNDKVLVRSTRNGRQHTQTCHR
jgi:hypothetical protein